MKKGVLLVLTLSCFFLAACNDSDDDAGNNQSAQQQLENGRSARHDVLANINNQAIAGDFDSIKCIVPVSADYSENGKLSQAFIDKIQSAREAGTDCN